MKFGAVPDPEHVDFTLPPDHPGTETVLRQQGGGGLSEVYVGCAKWNKSELKNFYPKGTKDELAYYSRQFNSIELNATFYNNYGPDQIHKWTEKVPDEFRFFPKVPRYISHIKRLNAVAFPVHEFCENVQSFGSKLGMSFLQMQEHFGPEKRERLADFLNAWSWTIPLAVELRNTEWFNEEEHATWLYNLLENYGVANVMTDTAGRRYLLHMRLTSPVAFVRYVGANHDSDYHRLDDWVRRIKQWKIQGLEKLYFFVHQNLEEASPYLSSYFIERLNEVIGTELSTPDLPQKTSQASLF